MLIYNQTNLNTKDIRPLVNFVAKKCQYSENAYIHILDTNNKMSAGQANFPNPFTLQTGKLNQVIIWLSKYKKYPKKSLHRKSVGTIIMNSWEEEFLFLLAHELRHVNQKWSFNPPYHLEVDAEKFAVKMLEQFRKKREKQ